MRACLVLGIGSLLWIPQVLAQQNPFIESDGRLIIEAESEAATGQWSLQSDIADYSGSGYHLWQGPNHFGAPPSNPENHIQYHFRISTAGNYQLRWRSRITVGDEATEHNDSWMRFTGGESIVGEHPIDGWTKVYMSQPNVWSWDAYTVDGQAKRIHQYFDAGDHLLEIAGRSNGHAIDRVALYQYETRDFSAAEFDSLAESRRADDALASHQQFAGTCFDNSLSLGTALEASLSADGSLVPSQLLLSSNGRYGYLQFDLSSVPESSTKVSLALVQRTAAKANLSVHTASHSEWHAGSARENLPDPAVQIGQATLNGSTGDVQFIELDLTQFERQMQTLILSVNSGTGDINLVGQSAQSGPRLQFSGAANLCSQLHAEVSEPMDTDEGNIEPSVEPPTQEPSQTPAQTPTQAPEENASSEQFNIDAPGSDAQDAQSPFSTVDTISESGDTQQSDSMQSTSVQTSTSSGGSLSVWALLLLAATGLRHSTRENRLLDD